MERLNKTLKELASAMFGLILSIFIYFFFFFSSRRRHTRFDCDWSSDVCSSDLAGLPGANEEGFTLEGLRRELERWQSVTPDVLRGRLIEFLKAVVDRKSVV